MKPNFIKYKGSIYARVLIDSKEIKNHLKLKGPIIRGQEQMYKHILVAKRFLNFLVKFQQLRPGKKGETTIKDLQTYLTAIISIRDCTFETKEEKIQEELQKASIKDIW